MERLMSLILSSTSGGSESGSTIDSLKNILKNPILYIVLGSIVAFFILLYLLRRNVKAKPGVTIIVTRKGRLHKVVDEQNPHYYLVPFRDKIGTVISHDVQELTSDKLYINNGPDALYRVHYSLKYKVVNPAEHFPFINQLEDKMQDSINDRLRGFAEQGNALLIVKEYNKQNTVILKEINAAISQFSLEAISFKVLFIEPLAGK